MEIMKFRTIVLVFILLSVFLRSFGAVGIPDSLPQENYRYYGIRIHYGSVIIHSRAIRDIGKANPSGLEFSMGWHSTSQQAWDACNCYPKAGVIVGVWNFDKPEILGWGISALAFIEPVFGAHKRVSFSIRDGTGFAYLSNPYDSKTNPFNFSYSTHIAFPLLLGITGNVRISPRLNMNLNLVYNHISNGGLREPNKGINWPSVSVGLDYHPVYQLPMREITDWRKRAGERHQTELFVFATARQLNHNELKKYPILGVELVHRFRISRLSLLSLGAEVMVDGTEREEISRNPALDADFKKAGIMAGHGFLLGRFIFGQAFGVYLYDTYKANDPVYQQYSLVYRLNRHWRGGVNLKAHRQVADFLDVRIGFAF